MINTQIFAYLTQRVQWKITKTNRFPLLSKLFQSLVLAQNFQLVAPLVYSAYYIIKLRSRGQKVVHLMSTHLNANDA